jgi:hypothetical protein
MQVNNERVIHYIGASRPPTCYDTEVQLLGCLIRNVHLPARISGAHNIKCFMFCVLMYFTLCNLLLY